MWLGPKTPNGTARLSRANQTVRRRRLGRTSGGGGGEALDGYTAVVVSDRNVCRRGPRGLETNRAAGDDRSRSVSYRRDAGLFLPVFKAIPTPGPNRSGRFPPLFSPPFGSTTNMRDHIILPPVARSKSKNNNNTILNSFYNRIVADRKDWIKLLFCNFYDSR